MLLGENDAVPGFRLGLERGSGGWMGPQGASESREGVVKPSFLGARSTLAGLRSHRPLLTSYIASYFSFSSLGLSFWK